MLQHFKKKLRSEQTNAETRLWYLLRDRRLKDYKFRRQVQLGTYIVDFLCHEQGLIIECDGGQHNLEEHRRYDEERTAFLQTGGYRVLRFWNNDILKNTEGVLVEVLKYLSPSPGKLRIPTSPTEGRGDSLAS